MRALSAWLLALAATTSWAGGAGAPPDRITGAFVTGLAGPADRAGWTRELREAKALGLDLIVVQQTADGDGAAYAPCTAGLPSPRGDALGALLAAADEVGGLTIFLGLGYRPDWKFDGSATAAEYAALTAFNLRVADDLIRVAARHPCVRGWYLPQEPDGQRTWLPAAAAPGSPLGRLVEGYYRPVIARLKAAGPDRPVSVAPFFGWNAMDPGTFGAWWTALLAACDLDLVILQDGVGVRHAWLDPAANRPGGPPCDGLAYLDAMRGACARSRRSLWLDLEAFREDGDASSPADFLTRTGTAVPVPGLREQLEREGPHLTANGPAGDRIVAYEYLEDLSRRGGPRALALRQAYAAWTRTLPAR